VRGAVLGLPGRVHLEYFYFHNCVYDHVWRDSYRRHSERTPTLDVIHKYGPDYKLIFVGDATMSPYEILQPNGSIEYSNTEAGAVWLRRLADAYPSLAWLNPKPSAPGITASPSGSSGRYWAKGCFRSPWTASPGPSPTCRAKHGITGPVVFLGHQIDAALEVSIQSRKRLTITLPSKRQPCWGTIISTSS
jgi:hypothetical protein